MDPDAIQTVGPAKYPAPTAAKRLNAVEKRCCSVFTSAPDIKHSRFTLGLVVINNAIILGIISFKQNK
jgi:hypothetical protein